MKGLIEAMVALAKPGPEGRSQLDELIEFCKPANVQARLDKISDATRAALKDAGFPPARLLSLNDLCEIEEVYTAKGLPESATVAARLCREVVASAECRQEMLNDWGSKSLCVPRMRILSAAMDAHARGAYELSVPALLAQLEGVVSDHKRPGGGRLRQSDIYSHVTDLSKQHPMLASQLAEFVENIVFADFVRGQQLPELSRHAILHGADTTYATEDNSTKAILTFDFVAELLEPAP
jgi:hypothetical protein